MSRIIEIKSQSTVNGSHQWRKFTPESEVTGPNLNGVKADVDIVKALGFDIIVGTQVQVDNILNPATHTISDFIAAITNQSRILILSGTHALAQDEVITETGVVLEKEDQSAIIQLGSFTFTVSGDENELNFRMDSAGLDALVISGNHNVVIAWSENGNADPFNDSGTGNKVDVFVV